MVRRYSFRDAVGGRRRLGLPATGAVALAAAAAAATADTLASAAAAATTFAAAARARLTRRDLAAGPELVLPLDHDDRAGLEPLLDHGRLADRRHDLDRLRGDGVVVVDDVHERALRP